MERDIRLILEKALSAAREKGQLPPEGTFPILLELPKEKGHGDLSTNLAMVLAKQCKIPPRLVAQTVVDNLPNTAEILEKVEIAGPGFINFFFSSRFVHQTLSDIAANVGKTYARRPSTGKRILIEFVSANPTGPLNVVNARAAAVGDTLARLLGACGFQADREFYVNDEGSQIENLARSVEARYEELHGKTLGEFPEDWYAGEYVKDLAVKVRDGFPQPDIFAKEGVKVYGKKIFTPERLEKLKSGFGSRLLAEIPESSARLRFLTSIAVIFMVNLQRSVLERFRLHFQSWYFQSQLGDRLQKGIETLKERGHLYEQEGALWFRTTAFRDDKDRVLVRKDSVPTYFAADIAYHAYKKERGYDLLIDLLGPDHHGYIARTKASIQALGYSADSLEIYLIQLVTLVSGGKPLRMSKRAGEFITMEELLDEVGVDAARWYFLNRHRDSHLEFDLDLAKLQSEENPLYYVQYAHARIASIIRMAGEHGVRVRPPKEIDFSVLAHEAERELIKKMAQWPPLVELAGQNRETHHLPRYAMELARTFHAFYTECRVLGDPGQEKLTEGRLCLVSTCKAVLADVLGMMGISAPEKM